MTNEEIIKQGGDDVAAKLWENNKRFIYQQAVFWIKSQRKITIDRFMLLDDLLQSGYLAVEDTLKHHNPEKGKFISLLSYYLKKHFTLCYAASSGWTLHHFREASGNNITVESLNRKINDEEGEIELGDEIADPDDYIEELLERLQHDYLSEKLKQLLERLEPEQKKAIMLKFYGGLSDKKVAEKMGVDYSKARRLLGNGLRALNARARHSDLREYVDQNTNFYFPIGVQSFLNTGYSSVEVIAAKREQLEYDYLKKYITQ